VLPKKVDKLKPEEKQEYFLTLRRSFKRIANTSSAPILKKNVGDQRKRLIKRDFKLFLEDNLVLKV